MLTSASKSGRLGFILGCLVALLGLVVLIGWYTHTIVLLRIYPTFVAMPYNTALSFFLSGLALAVASAGKNRKVSAYYGIVVLLIGCITLAEYIFGRQFGIDELFMKAYIRAGIVFYGRMAICSAICFTLSGLGILLLSAPPERQRTLVISVLGSVILCFGFVAFTGYSVGVNAAYEWGRFTRMAMHTSIAFMALGSAFLALCWSEHPNEAGCMPRWVPSSAGIGFVAITMALWQALVIQQSAQFAIIRRLTPSHNDMQIDPLVRTQYMIPYVVMAIGFVFAFLMAWLVHMAQMAAVRAELLRVAHGDLERRVAERTVDLDRSNQALREVLTSVSHGKLRLCATTAELPPTLTRYDDKPPIQLTLDGGMRDLRNQVRQASALCNLPDDRGIDLITAVGEASMNAVVHCGYGEAVVYTSPEGKIQVWISDKGSGITMEHLPRATLERGYTTAGTLGHGFWLMLNTVDCVYLLTGPSGTTVVLEQGREANLSFWLQKQIDGSEFVSAG